MRIPILQDRPRSILAAAIALTLLAGVGVSVVRTGDGEDPATVARDAPPPASDVPVRELPPLEHGGPIVPPVPDPARSGSSAGTAAGRSALVDEVGVEPFPPGFEPSLLPAVSQRPIDFIAQRALLSRPVFRPIVAEALHVPMPDGITLYVEVTRPDPSAHGDGPWPVIMEISPYHGTIATRIGDRIFPDPTDADGKPLGLTGYFAPRGYAVAMVGLRGTGRSQGCLDHLGPNDARDIKAVVEWAAEQPWSNGRVGLTGHSYVGSTPAVAAAMRPKGLVTIVPSAGLASMYDHQFQHGVPYAFQWVGPMYAYEELAINRHLPPFLGSGHGDNFGNDMQYFGCGLPNSALTAGHGQVNGQYQDWHAERDWREGAARAPIPIFMVHGVNDNAARIPAAQWFFEMRDPHPEDKVWIGQWDHGTSNPRHPNGRFEQWQYALHAWFDRHLKRMPVDTGPPVEAFLNGERVHAAPRWGLRDETVKLWAQGIGLTTHEPGAEGSVMTIALGGSAGYFFTSEPVEEDMVIVGTPRIRLHASITGPVVHLIPILYALGEDGGRRHISTCAIQPQLREGIDRTVPVVPGQEMALDPQCFTTAHHLRKGESLRLDVTTTSPHHVPLFAVDPLIRIFTGPGKTSVELPVVRPARLYRDVR